MRKTLITTGLLCFICQPLTSLAAAKDGLYLGLQLGSSHASYSPSSEGITSPLYGNEPISESSSSGFAFRLYGGYQFIKFAAAEVGFSSYNNVTIKNIYGIDGAKETIEPMAIDIVGKAMIPLTEQFDIFAKLGASYMNVKRSFNVPEPFPEPNSETQSKFRATYGLGADYNITPAFSIDLSWMQVQGGAGFEKTQFSSLGAAYHFG